MAKPIFILGHHRSGTTWLANQLCEHSQIAGIRHEKHYGIHESVFFSHIQGRYGNLKSKTNFKEFAEVMFASDYFQISGVTKEFLFSLCHCDYHEVFRKVMDDYADRNGTAYWLEKSPNHTLLVREIAAFYPDAIFIHIERQLHDVLRSALNQPSRRNFSRFKRCRMYQSIISAWVHYSKVIKKCGLDDSRLLRFRYKDLKGDMRGTLEGICNFIGIHFEENLMEQHFRPNSSFSSEKHRESQSFSPSERLFITMLKRFYMLLPLKYFKVKQSLTMCLNRLRHRHLALPYWFFRLSGFSDEHDE